MRPYIEFEGEVEIRWSNGAIVKDLLHYLDHNKEFKDYNGEFDPNMCKKDPYCSLPQTVLWCRACSCEQKQMGISRGKSTSIKPMSSEGNGIQTTPLQVLRTKKAKTTHFSEKDVIFSLTELLQRHPTHSALWLNHIHEWNDPSGYDVMWYTCTLQGCKSA